MPHTVGNPQTAGLGWREAKMSNWKIERQKSRTILNNTGNRGMKGKLHFKPYSVGVASNLDLKHLKVPIKTLSF